MKTILIVKMSLEYSVFCRNNLEIILCYLFGYDFHLSTKNIKCLKQKSFFLYNHNSPMTDKYNHKFLLENNYYLKTKTKVQLQHVNELKRECDFQ